MSEEKHTILVLMACIVILYDFMFFNPFLFPVSSYFSKMF